MSNNIKQIELLFSQFLGKYNELLNYQVKPINSGSEIYVVSLKVRDVDSKKEKGINIIAKTYPGLKAHKKLYDVEVGIRKEIFFYEKVLVAVQEFHEEYITKNRFDVVPDYYGSRLSLDPQSNKPDMDAVLLLENLTSSGFKTVDRAVGFDKETIKIIVTDLAIFHAVPLAYKLQKPQKFKQVFQEHFVSSVVKAVANITPEEQQKIRQNTVKAASEGLPKCSLYASRITQALEAAQNHLKNPPPINDHFATLTHNNLWLNNILVKFVGTKPIKAKFIDFKVAAYDSFIKDLVFLLFSSVQKAVLDVHFDELVRCYHTTFLQTLESYHCDTNAYDLKKFYDEIGRVIRTTELLHLSLILKIVYGNREIPSKKDEFDLEKLMHEEGSYEYKRRLAETINFFVERNWI